MLNKVEAHIEGKHGRPVVYDFRYEEGKEGLPVLIFAHGFKGFKDWGPFNLIADAFALAGYAVLKFNFSHNGGTLEQPIDFPDLEAFANNNFSIEMDDLGVVIDALCDRKIGLELNLNINKLCLLGHSRGGGIVLLKSKEDRRVSKVISWAGVSTFERWDIDTIESWKRDGYIVIKNGRTKQNMPIYYQLYDNYMANLGRLDIARACSSLSIPQLIVHGNKDESVDKKEALSMMRWNPKAKLSLIPEANHTFGGKHPWDNEFLPDYTIQAINESIDFLNK